MIGDHGYGIVEAYDLAHALHRFRLAIVEARELAAEHRAGGHRCDLHARNFDVDAELGLAIHLVRGVEPLGGRPNQLEVFRFLEDDLIRHASVAALSANAP